MQTFYFDIEDGFRLSKDTDGSQLPSLEQARIMAIHTLHEISRLTPMLDRRRTLRAIVRDEIGEAIMTVTLSIAVESAPSAPAGPPIQ